MFFQARNLHLFQGLSMAMLVITRWYLDGEIIYIIMNYKYGMFHCHV